MRASIALVLSLVALRSVCAEDATTYPLKFEYKPAVGKKLEVIVSETASEKMKMSSDGQVVSDDASETASAYEMMTEITAADGKDLTGARWTFKKARKTKNGEETTLGFEGKTVLGKRGEGKVWSYEYEDGSEVAEDEVSDLASATDTKNGDRPPGPEMFSPKNPVKSGDSWSPDMDVLAEVFGDENAKIDIKASKATCSLKDVENRGRAAYGIVSFDLDLKMVFLPPMKMDKPLSYHCTGDLDVCIDDTQPYGTLTMNLAIEGNSKGTVTKEGKEVPVEMELHAKNSMTRTTKGVK